MPSSVQRLGGYARESHGDASGALLRPKKDHQVLWLAPVAFLIFGGVVIMARGTKKEVVEEQKKEEVSDYRASSLKELEED